MDANTNHHLGPGVVKQVTARHETINNTMFTEGDIAVAIQWLDRTEEDADGLSFCKELNDDGAASASIINSTELRAASSTPFECGLHFTMSPELDTSISPAFVSAATPAVTRTGRGAAVVELAHSLLPPDGTVYVIPARVD